MLFLITSWSILKAPLVYHTFHFYQKYLVIYGIECFRQISQYLFRVLSSYPLRVLSTHPSSTLSSYPWRSVSALYPNQMQRSTSKYSAHAYRHYSTIQALISDCIKQEKNLEATSFYCTGRYLILYFWIKHLIALWVAAMYWIHCWFQVYSHFREQLQQIEQTKSNAIIYKRSATL
jgi:hypothetical protein